MSDHAFRVYKALRYIDENLFSQIDLDSIASAGAFSPFHFHRVFTSLLGVSVSEYVWCMRGEKVFFGADQRFFRAFTNLIK